MTQPTPSTWRGLVTRGASSPTGLRVATTLLFGLFLALLMAALLFGVNSYREITAQGNATQTARASLGMLVNTVKGHDRISSVSLADGQQRLVLEEVIGANTFETAIFLKDGMICQQSALAGSEVSDAAVIQVAPSSQLSFDYDDGLLTITTDEGSASVYLRSHGAEGRSFDENPATGEVVIL